MKKILSTLAILVCVFVVNAQQIKRITYKISNRPTVSFGRQVKALHKSGFHAVMTEFPRNGYASLIFKRK